MVKKAAVNQVLEPMQNFNALAVANTERLVKIQLDAIARYTDLGIAQMKAVAELRSADELPNYQAKSAELLKTAADAVRADAEAATEFGAACVSDVQKLVQANLEGVTRKAA